MKQKQEKAITQIQKLILSSKNYFNINPDKTEPVKTFETLKAIEKSAYILNKAWKLSLKHNLDNFQMRQDFLEIFTYFSKIKGNINKNIKHKH